jgi:hypothetical protein
MKTTIKTTLTVFAGLFRLASSAFGQQSVPFNPMPAMMVDTNNATYCPIILNTQVYLAGLLLLQIHRLPR